MENQKFANTLPFSSVIQQVRQTDMTLAKKELGKTGEKLSVLGFGGILVMEEVQKEANELVALAFERGINYFDVSPEYGNAEDVLGPALEPWRKQSFLACKTKKRDKAGARADLESSLQKMRTDYFDLYQMHTLFSTDEVEQAFGPNGAMETFIQARKEGLVKHLGFSAHNEAAALLAMEKFDFDTILLPINYAAWLSGSFGPAAVEKAKAKGMGILALKGLAKGTVPDQDNRPVYKCWYEPINIKDDELARLAFTFTYAQGITAALPPGEPQFFPRALQLAANISDLKDDELETLKNLAGEANPIFSNT